MAGDITSQLSAVLQNMSLGYIFGLFIKVLTSSFTLYLSVRLVGGKSSFKKSIILTTAMEIVNLIILPMFTTGVFSLFFYILIWLILVTVFFDLSLWKAILVSLVQGIVTIIFVLLGIVTLIAFLFGSIFLIR